ncbi:MAG TPA: hypothetical protein VF765_30500 [Polyangiaceae bacterium]
MNVELSESQARFLKKHLELRVDELEKEAARTDRHDLQHALAVDIERLKEILARVEDTLRPEAAVRA